ncbi:unnamed protein product [Staurois parvus]|uniref:Uncharacterized protein n=1 Tax=Staurois parvus TaxID=386267 RepID=A0ABN9GTP9_9NEOB|nr:unnamed protein product [Staurois parvus]
MVRVTSQESNRRSQQRSGSGRVCNKSGKKRNAGYKIQGPMEKNTHQGTDCRSGHPLNTPPAISPR